MINLTREVRSIQAQREIAEERCVLIVLRIRTTRVQPVSMKYQFISIELRAMGVAGTAPKVEGLAA